jgi:hypothetical protein
MIAYQNRRGIRTNRLRVVRRFSFLFFLRNRSTTKNGISEGGPLLLWRPKPKSARRWIVVYNVKGNAWIVTCLPNRTIQKVKSQHQSHVVCLLFFDHSLRVFFYLGLFLICFLARQFVDFQLCIMHGHVYNVDIASTHQHSLGLY